MPEQTVRIPARFRGPPDSGNGGYFAGIVAKALGGSEVAVTLRNPAPLDRDLTLRSDETLASLHDGDILLATGERRRVEIEVPAAPSMEEASAAERRYSGFTSHLYPGCFVCGPDRDSDGLRIHPGPLGELVASTWRPDASLGSDGSVDPEFVWAALDCPGYFAVEEQAGRALLGRIAAVIEERVPLGERLIVAGWPVASEGRKHHVGTAIFDGGGRVLARAASTWVTIS